MRFFENVYDFIAKKFVKLFVFIGFGAFVLALLFAFIGGVSTNGDGTFGYLVSLVFNGIIFAGIVIGYFFKKKKMLIASSIALLVLILYNGIVTQTAAVQAVFVDNGADVANWIFGFIFDLVVAAYIVFLVLINLFNFKGLEKISHIIYLAIFPAGLLAWIMGIVFAANNGAWYNAIIPLFECASFLFFPGVLAVVLDEPKPAPAPAPAKEEAPTKEEAPVKEEKKEDAPEAVEPEVQEDKKD
ncbi:MAG: hypothetical protein K5906_00235 [Bacilli bacterium]|nr:hypothetical protein [Bacilli bacterium]